MNNSKSGLAPSASADTGPKTRGPVNEGTWSGPTGMDQSVRIGGEAPPTKTNPGNCLPPLPPIKHGN